MVGAGWRDLDVVFDNGRGGRIDPQWPTNRLRSLVKLAKVPYIGVHGLRHTSATLALDAGVDVRVVSQRLGHSSVGITWDTYSHVLADHRQDAADKLGAFLANTGT
jgi:integrase